MDAKTHHQAKKSATAMFVVVTATAILTGCTNTATNPPAPKYTEFTQASLTQMELSWTQGLDKYTSLTDAEWKTMLTPEQYNILRKKGTETPFSSPLDKETRPGTYVSVGCNEPVFRSEQKYDSGTGWPSFWAPVNPDALILQPDTSILPERTEVLDKCGNHLGHVFNDGPAPTGLRYCMNGTALKFIPDSEDSTNPPASTAPQK